MKAETLLSRCDARVAEIAAAVRNMLFEALPGVEESPDEAANIIGYGHGPGYKGLIATIILSRKGVKLGLNRGAALPDPDGLLTGSGKVHRYVEIGSPEEARAPALLRLVEAAKAAFEDRSRAVR